MESAYPYTAKDGSCYANQNGYYYNGAMTGAINKWITNENDLKALLVEHGPVVTAFDANGLNGYGGGVLDSPDCCNAATLGILCT